MSKGTGIFALLAGVVAATLLMTAPVVEIAQAASQASPAASPSPEVERIEFRGLFAQEGAMTLADLQDLPTETIETTFISEDGAEVQHTYTGVRLWDVLQQAELIFDAELPEDSLHKYIVLTARDGYVVVIALADIDPSVGARPYLLAWMEDGEMLSEEQGPVRLVAPGDLTEARYIFGIASIEVRDVTGTPDA
jgi:DMSO/TMAO reductase YedYZ molybdopterin-dependent catalytic subunit